MLDILSVAFLIRLSIYNSLLTYDSPKDSTIL